MVRSPDPTGLSCVNTESTQGCRAVPGAGGTQGTLGDQHALPGRVRHLLISTGQGKGTLAPQSQSTNGDYGQSWNPAQLARPFWPLGPSNGEPAMGIVGVLLGGYGPSAPMRCPGPRRVGGGLLFGGGLLC